MEESGKEKLKIQRDSFLRWILTCLLTCLQLLVFPHWICWLCLLSLCTWSQILILSQGETGIIPNSLQYQLWFQDTTKYALEAEIWHLWSFGELCECICAIQFLMPHLLWASPPPPPFLHLLCRFLCLLSCYSLFLTRPCQFSLLTHFSKENRQEMSFSSRLLK